ncbi:MAG: hypothetical protein M3Y59_15360 [Myxococcota bacterium]|nr:hypothetical protein [Myxococcota bacterium]
MKFLCPACDRLAEIASHRLDLGTLVLRCARCGAESREESGPGAAPAPRSPMPAPALAAPAPVVSSSPESALADAAPWRAPSVPERPVVPGASSAAATGVESPGQVVFLRALSPSTAYPASREDPLAVPDGYCPKCISLRRMGGPSCASCGLSFAAFNPEEHSPPAPLLEAWRVLAQSWEDNDAHDRFLQLSVEEGTLAAAGRLYRIQLAHNRDDPFAARGRDEVVKLAAAASALNLAAEEGPTHGLSRRAQQGLLAVLALFLLVMLGLLIRSLTSMGAG